ncbi:2-amino-4-hydroxy-6-hydroxymethyldihydropteridine diphosphokinase [Actinomyces sp.]|uniref:2-amino-4-hydroxy-6- hydroxymethyldihydropteridine diphosphokinase n=1 Tax=Actinomyces sp. TaxID=29317 RepID=UPI0026DCB60D|nr:2-amino-4-hydroxy-6-hydroxymethyldihydropteridine diphosphokinase [Actinomyces sp.]MDO4655759.1 2-amino-4-hydroxy-6-hydroxymethyldihydropteridine diphosphokinase [Actinomyces sp.]
MSTTVSATTDRISLIGLSARGHHGVLPFEREEGQLFTVDVILDLGQRGTAVAAVTDSVTDAVDYSRVANGIVSIIEGEPVNLIESLADRIAERVLSFPRVVAAEVTVHKPEAPLDVAFEDVSVTIHRVADAAAGHDGAPATSQAAWAAQAEAPVAVSAQPYASPSSASPAAPAYEPPAAPVVSEAPDFSGASFTGGDAAPAALASEAPITPTPSPASPMEAPARSSFAAAAPSVPTPMPTEPGTPGGGTESTQPWVPDWATESADSSVSSAPAWAPETPEAPEATGLPSSEAAGSYSASSALDAPSTSAPTAASAGRTAGADGFVSLAADALGAAPAPSEPEPSVLSYAEEVAADASAAASSEPTPAAGNLAVQLPREGRHVASSEEGEDQFAPAVEGSADLLGGPVAFDESGSYSGAASSQAGHAGDTAPEAAGVDAGGFALPALGGDATSGTAGADGLMDASSVPASQPLGEPGPSPFAVPDEFPGAAGQEGVAPAYSEPSYSQPSVSEDFSQPVEGSYAAPSAQPDFLGAPGAAPAPAAPEVPAAPAAPVDPLSERPTRPVGVVFGLGANVGGVVDSLRTAVQSLKATEGIEVTQVAPLARTIAVVAEGAEPQPDYLNTVVTAMTTLAPRELLEVCQTLEIAAGRVRTEPWGVRTLDVDLIEVEGVTSSDPALSLPHPRAAERAFVLVPWSQADPFAELAGRSVSELAENAPDRGGLRWLAFDWLDSESLPDKPTGPYVEPPVEQDAAGSEPGLVYDATRDESSVADASLAADYAGSIAEASSAAPEPAPAQPLGDQGQVESSPFGQLPFDTSNEAGSWTEQAPQVDSPYQAASAPEAAGPQGSYAPGLSAGSDGVSQSQQDVGSYANYASSQQEQADAPASQQQNDAAGDAWKSPLQWNDVIGGGAQGTGPRQDV